MTLIWRHSLPLICESRPVTSTLFGISGSVVPTYCEGSLSTLPAYILLYYSLHLQGLRVLSSVFSFVPLKMAFPFKTPFTFIALIRPLSRMYSFVFCEIAPVRKCFFTILTIKWFLTIVYSYYMGIQITSFRKVFHTDTTLERFFTVQLCVLREST